MNTSPVVGLYDDPTGRARHDPRRSLAAGPADIDVRDDDGTRHRLWVVAADGPAATEVAELIAIAAPNPVTIADGHHRYETALRYRDERRMSPLVRGGSGVRLPPDAVPRDDGRAADRAPDAPPRGGARVTTACQQLRDGLVELFTVRRCRPR